MEAFAIALEGFALAEWLRFSRWGYAAISATHLLGISLLVGAIATLDLRLVGLWKSTSIALLYRVLSPVAASGLAIAISSGIILFSVRATEYAELDLLLVKLVLIVVGAIFAVVIHLRCDLAHISISQQRLVGAFSLLIWLAALVCGRLLAFL